MLNKSVKIPKSFRFSSNTLQELQRMAVEQHTTETSLIEHLVHEAWFKFTESEKRQLRAFS